MLTLLMQLPKQDGDPPRKAAWPSEAALTEIAARHANWLVPPWNKVYFVPSPSEKTITNPRASVA